MEYYEISVPDRNDSVMRVNLDGTYYYLRVTWNAYGEFWMLSIYDADMQMKIGMAKLVPGAIWNFYYLNSNGPPGILGVQTDKERIGRQDFVDAVAHLYYLPAEQMGCSDGRIWPSVQSTNRKEQLHGPRTRKAE